MGPNDPRSGLGRKWPICGVVAPQRPISGRLVAPPFASGPSPPNAASIGFEAASSLLRQFSSRSVFPYDHVKCLPRGEFAGSSHSIDSVARRWVWNRIVEPNAGKWQYDTPNHASDVGLSPQTRGPGTWRSERIPCRGHNVGQQVGRIQRGRLTPLGHRIAEDDHGGMARES